MGCHPQATDQRLYRTTECEISQGSSHHRTILTIRAKVTKQVRNLVYINAEITNSKGELCNEGEAIYFLMNQEKAKEMGFIHCDVEE